MKSPLPNDVMNFNLTVLGSSAAIPANGRNLSAHVLNAHERFYLIDCGEGTQFQLKRYRIPMGRIRAVMISHLHGDHYFGLIGLLNTMHMHGRTEELHIYAPSQLEQIISIQLETALTILRYPLHFHLLRHDGPDLLFETERLEVRNFPLHHSIPTCGFIFREKNPPRKVGIPRSYAYCSDTGYDESIVNHIRGVAVLYHEATFMDALASVAAEKLHSTARQAAMIAHKAGAGTLLLGHFSARYDDPGPILAEARTIFPETYAVTEGETLTIGSEPLR